MLYAPAARLGISPLEVDEMEVWQVGAMFGMPDDEVPEEPGAPGVRSPGMGEDLVAARFRALTGRGPKMDAAPSGADLIQYVERVEGRRG